MTTPSLPEAAKLALAALEESRDDVTNTLNSYVDHPANERKRKLILDQLARHDKAHDALDAALSASAEPMEPVTGMVLVPRVATDAMLRACNNGPGQMVLTNREIWRAMVAASQT